MADKGYDIQVVTAKKDIQCSPRLEFKKKQMAALDEERTRRIAKMHIHVEMVIGHGRRFEVV